MKFLIAAAITLPFSVVLSAPTIGSGSSLSGPELVPVQGGDAVLVEPPAGGDTEVADPVVEDPAAGEPAEGGEGEAGEGEAGEGEEDAANEVELEAAFGDTVALEGGDLKQDVLYPPGVGHPLDISSVAPRSHIAGQRSL